MSKAKLIAGRYQQIELIGAGGMGAVYRGRDDLTGDYVAIKELKSDVLKQDPEIVQRFEREGEALRKLNHPSIVKVLASVQEGAEHYIVLEYVQGGSLRDKLDKTPQLPIREILEIGLDLADALARAHRLNIIHRDIKPANVLMADDGSPRLTDFGVAHIGDSSQLTKTGVVMGTLSYLPPEALAGDRIDHRADIWAFGVMLYEMVAGQRPFDGDNSGAVITGILQKEPPDLLQTRPLAEMENLGYFAGLIYWMLDKDREKRPDSFRLIGALLENLLAGKAIELKPQISQGAKENSLSQREAAAIMREYGTDAFRLSASDYPTNTPASIQILSQSSQTPPAASQATQPPSSAKLWIGLAFVLLLALVLGLGAFLLNQNPSANSSISIEAVASGKFMVLVAQPQFIDGTERNVQNFIVQDLEENLASASISLIEIRAYPAVIHSSSEAQAIAEEYDAHLILWGNYDSQRVEMNIQVGDLSLFPYLQFSPEDVQRFANATYQMSNEREASLGFGVLSAFTVIHTMANDPLGIARNVLISQLIAKPSATVQGNGANAYYHRFMSLYSQDTPAALAELSAAIDRVEPHAFLHIARSLAYQRLNRLEDAQREIRIARQLVANPNWILPEFSLSNAAVYFEQDYAKALEIFPNNFPEVAGGDWFFPAYRGILRYFTHDYVGAEADTDLALSLNPTINLPYGVAASLAFRRGDVLSAWRIFEVVRERFPDARQSSRIILATFNENAATTPFSRYILAFGRLVPGEWEAILSDTDVIIESDLPPHPDFYFLRGFAYCNLGQFAEAEAAYTTGLELDPDYVLLHALRAEVRFRQGLLRLVDAQQDIDFVLNSGQNQLITLAPSVVTGAYSCQNFFTFDFATLLETTEEANQ